MGDRLPHMERDRLNLTQLVETHHQDVYRYAYRLCGDRHLAEELSQQTFLQAALSWEQLREPAKARGWLLAIVRNAYRMERRKRRPYSETDSDVPLHQVVQPGDPALDDPQLFDREEIQQALAILPDTAREILLAFYFEELSYREISEQFALPLGTVMSRLSRAKALLKQELQAALSQAALSQAALSQPALSQPALATPVLDR